MPRWIHSHEPRPKNHFHGGDPNVVPGREPLADMAARLDTAAAAKSYSGPHELHARVRAGHAVRQAVNDAMARLQAANNGRADRPSIDALVDEFASGLPPKARSAFREFMAEADPIIRGGDFDSVREGRERLVGELVPQLTEAGWRPSSEASSGESPAELAARIPRV